MNEAMRTTHTFAVLELSAAAYAEIAVKLRDVEYGHAFIEQDERTVIDMHGIAVAKEKAEDCEPWWDGHASRRRRLHVRFVISVQEKQCSNITNERKKNMSATTVKLTLGQQVTIGALFETAKGAVVPVSGVPAWASDNGTAVAVLPAADGLSTVIQGLAPGTANISVSGEGDPQPGADTVTGVIQVTVVNPEASQVVFNIGTPTDIPAPAAAAAPAAA